MEVGNFIIFQNNDERITLHFLKTYVNAATVNQVISFNHQKKVG